jgi:hypothetical protein
VVQTSKNKKPGRKIDLDLAARILVDARYMGMDAAAARHNVSSITAKRYAVLAESDPILKQKVQEKLALAETKLDGNWIESLPGAIKGHVEFLQRASRVADPQDPKAIYSIAGALKILTDVALTSRVIDARLSNTDRPDREEAGSIPSSEEGSPTILQ